MVFGNCNGTAAVHLAHADMHSNMSFHSVSPVGGLHPLGLTGSFSCCSTSASASDGASISPRARAAAQHWFFFITAHRVNVCKHKIKRYCHNNDLNLLNVSNSPGNAYELGDETFSLQHPLVLRLSPCSALVPSQTPEVWGRVHT